MASSFLPGVLKELVDNVILPKNLNEIEHEEEHMRVVANMKLGCKD
jgi:hypothetical protein